MTEKYPGSQKEHVLDNIDVIAFDWDMTIVDSHGKLLQNQAIALEFGNPLSIDEVRRHWNESTSFPDLMARLTNGAPMDNIMKVVKRDYHNPEFAKKSFDFAVPTIKELRRRGLQTALVSSVQRELLHQDAADLGIYPALFDFVQAQDDCEFKKPDGRVFDRLLRNFGITAQRLLYVGDEEKDFRAATSAGAHFIGVETGMVTAQEFDAMGAVHIPTLKEITTYGTI